MRVQVFLALATLVLTSACTTPPSDPYEGVSFLPTARDISSAFLRPNGDLYLVPQKGVIVEGVNRPDGVPLAWHVNGSYLVIPSESLHAVNAVHLEINGKVRLQPLRIFESAGAPLAHK